LRLESQLLLVPLIPVLFRLLVFLLVLLRLDVQVQVVVSSDGVLVLEQSLVGALKGLWHHRQLLIQLLLGLLPRLLNATEGQSRVGGVKKNLNNIDALSSRVKHLLPSLLGQQLRILTDLWLELRFFTFFLVLVVLESLLLLQSVDSQQLEVSLDWGMLSLSNEEKSGILIIDT
jgi:hypothetical protein